GVVPVRGRLAGPARGARREPAPPQKNPTRRQDEMHAGSLPFARRPPRAANPRANLDAVGRRPQALPNTILIGLGARYAGSAASAGNTRYRCGSRPTSSPTLTAPLRGASTSIVVLLSPVPKAISTRRAGPSP